MGRRQRSPISPVDGWATITDWIRESRLPVAWQDRILTEPRLLDRLLRQLFPRDSRDITSDLECFAQRRKWWSGPSPKRRRRLPGPEVQIARLLRFLDLPSDLPIRLIDASDAPTDRNYRWDCVALPLLMSLEAIVSQSYPNLVGRLWDRLAHSKLVNRKWLNWPPTDDTLNLEGYTTHVNSVLEETYSATLSELVFLILPVTLHAFYQYTPHHAYNVVVHDGYLPLDAASLAIVLATLPELMCVREETERPIDYPLGSIVCLGTVCDRNKVFKVQPPHFRGDEVGLGHHNFHTSSSFIRYAVAALPEEIRTVVRIAREHRNQFFSLNLVPS